MFSYSRLRVFCALILFSGAVAAQTAVPDLAELARMVGTLQQQLDAANARHEGEIRALRAEIDQLRAGSAIAAVSTNAGGDSVAVCLAADATNAVPVDGAAEDLPLYERYKDQFVRATGNNALLRTLDLSVVIDGAFWHDTGKESSAHLKNEIAGFGHHHGADDGHHHDEIEDGFNLRHVELGLSAEVDPYFRAWVIGTFEADGAALEEAVIQSTSLPYGLTLSAGRMLSGIGRINRQHPHSWDFFDAPLVYETLLGPHGLSGTGAQLTWLAPTPFYLLAGVEALNGENEKQFAAVEADALPEHDNPNVFTAFVKTGPDLGPYHALLVGASAATGYNQEAHDGDEDGANDHWLDGRSTLFGLDACYKYDAKGDRGRGDVIVQAEYLRRYGDMELTDHALNPALVGNHREATQDGYYVQSLYGVAPRWRGGVRWDQIGLINEVDNPDGSSDDFATSRRLTAMADWRLTEFSLLRFQVGRGWYTTAEGLEAAWEFALQLAITFGEHPAHSF